MLPPEGFNDLAKKDRLASSFKIQRKWFLSGDSDIICAIGLTSTACVKDALAIFHQLKNLGLFLAQEHGWYFRFRSS